MTKPNGHHVLFPKALHNVQEPTKQLRRNQWLIPPVEYEPHERLHRAVGIVAVMDYITANKVLKLYEPYPGDYIRSIEMLMFTMEAVAKSPRVPAIETGIVELAIAGIDAQLPFIREGLIDVPS